MGNESRVSEEFVRDFYNDIQQLINYRPVYAFRIKLIESKHGTSEGDLEKIPEQDKNDIIEAAYNIRHWVSRTYMEFDALSEHVSEFGENKEKIAELFKEIDGVLIPDAMLVTRYTTEMIKLFSKGFGAEVLSKATEKMSKLVDDYSGEDVGGEQPKK